MEIKDFKIGNLVSINTEKTNKLHFFQVTKISRNYVFLNDEKVKFGIDKIKPIPLTKELLLRLGFNSTRIGKMEYFIHQELKGFFTFEFDSLIYFNKSYINELFTVKYLHQLQNALDVIAPGKPIKFYF